jgi:hypothetical protein
VEPDPEFEAAWRYLLGDETPKLRGKFGRRREPLTGPAALFAEHFRVHGGGYGIYDLYEYDDLARDLAVKRARAMKSQQDAAEFRRLGGRPRELSVLVAWDNAGLPREALLARFAIENEGVSTFIEEVRARRMTVDLAAQILRRSETS